jgi:hypothetical protein
MDVLTDIDEKTAHIRAKKDRLRERIARIQDEVDALAAEERTLNSRRNTLSPLCRLPSEVLCHVLRAAAHSGYRHAAGYRRPEEFGDLRLLYGAATNWTRVTSICAHIRHVAVSWPVLWTRIDLGWDPSWVQLCIARASSLPISLNLHEDLGVNYSLYMHLLLHRAQELTIHNLSTFVHNSVVLAYLQQPLPNLRSLCLSPGRDRQHYLSLQFLGRATSSLTHLALWKITLDAAVPIHLSFPSLLFLDFQGAADGSDQASRLLQLLARCPRLQHLYLEDVGLDCARTDAKHALLHLPDLMSLSIYDSIEGIMAGISLLPAPSDSYRFSLEGADYTNVAAHVALWEKVAALAHVDLALASDCVRTAADDSGGVYPVFEAEQVAPRVTMTYESYEPSDGWNALVHGLAQKGLVFGGLLTTTSWP